MRTRPLITATTMLSVVGLASTGDRQFVEIPNATGVNAASLQVSVNGGAAMQVDPATVTVVPDRPPVCPAPAVSTSGIIARVTVIDWGVACVDPDSTVRFPATTTFGRVVYSAEFRSGAADGSAGSEASEGIDTPPGEVSNLLVSGDAAHGNDARLSWSPVPQATAYSVLRSPTAQIGPGAQCLVSQHPFPSLADPYDPDPSGSHYLVRAINQTEAGPWGFNSQGVETMSNTCSAPGGPCQQDLGVIPITSGDVVRFCASSEQSCTGRQWPIRATWKSCWDAFGDTCTATNECGTENRCGAIGSGSLLTLDACAPGVNNTCGQYGVSCECKVTVPAETTCRCDCMAAGDTGLWTKIQQQ